LFASLVFGQNLPLFAKKILACFLLSHKEKDLKMMKFTIKNDVKTRREDDMKRTTIIIFMAVLSMVLTYGYADAQLVLCSACHTMHDSQDGQEWPGGAAGPQQRLLINSCIGCHTGATGAETADGAPIVNHTTAPTDQGASQTLAGGDFYWVNDTTGAGDDTMGHNVVGIAAADANILAVNTPPGWDQAVTTAQPDFDGKSMQVTQNAGWDASNRLTCAGTYGCHGTHDLPDFGGISGSHHLNQGSNDSVTADPTTVAGSYRFLANIRGIEHVDWNFGETAASHNEYFGANLATDRDANLPAAFGSYNTISYMCAQCHGTFHGSADFDAVAGSPWVRHPTDITLPNTGEYQYYNPDAGATRTYHLDVPLARAVLPPADSSVGVPGSDIVMCLSCHRAHGSNEPDLLRFTYDMEANQTGDTVDDGCFVCHTAKNDDTGPN
jgi:predicted CXXCH cytochrome family protein